MTKLKASKNYVLRKIAKKNVLVSVGEGVADFCGIVTLNNSAALMWNTLKEGTTQEELVEVLMNTYDVTKEQAQADVEKTIQMLLEREMIINE